VNPNELVKEVQLKCGAIPGVRLFRQNVGLAYSREQLENLLVGRPARPVQYGTPGMADLTGIAGPTGKRIEIECKVGAGRQNKFQKLWQAMIESQGGIYLLARSVDQAVRDLRARLGVPA
jgi:hypothetical protein